MNSSRYEWGGWVLLGVVFLGLSGGIGRYYYVGAIHDDAQYLLGGMAIREGSYLALQTPGQPPITVHPPGYPFLLSLFAGFSQQPWWLLRGLSLLCVLLSCLLLRRLAPPGVALPASALFALHPITLCYATTLLSEPLFIVWVLAAFTALRTHLQNGSPQQAVLLALSAGFAALTRSSGVLLILSMAAGLCTARRWKTALLTALLSLALAASFPLRNHLKGQPIFGEYAAIWKYSWDLLPNLFSAFASTWAVAESFFTDHFLSLSPWMSLPGVLRILLTGVVVFVLGCAFRAQTRRSVVDRALAYAVLFYIVATVLLHGLWEAREPRYVLALLPFLTWWFVEGCWTLSKGWDRRAKRAARLCLVGGLGVSYGSGYTVLVRQAANDWQTGSGRPPVQTYQWVRQTLPANAVVLYGKPAEFYLYTNRKTVGPLRAADAMQFRFALLQTGVTHILVRPVSVGFAGNTAQRSWDANQFWAATWPGAFAVLYQNPQESTSLFSVLPAARFAATYALYLRAQKAEVEGNREATFNHYEKILRSDRTILPVLLRYGELALSTNTRLSAALGYLLRTSPPMANHPLLLFLRARIYDRLGERREAEQSLEKARTEARTQSAFVALSSDWQLPIKKYNSRHEVP